MSAVYGFRAGSGGSAPTNSGHLGAGRDAGGLDRLLSSRWRPGLALAAGEGGFARSCPLQLIIGAFILTVAIGALFTYERPLFLVVSLGHHGLRHRPSGGPQEDVEEQIPSGSCGWSLPCGSGWCQVVAVLCCG